MKKKSIQKFMVLSGVLAIVFNLPFIFVFNKSKEVLGMPMLYFSILFIWFLAVLFSMYFSIKKDE